MPTEDKINGIFLRIIGGLALVLAISLLTFMNLRGGDELPPLNTAGQEHRAEQRAALDAAPTPIDEAMRLVVAETKEAGSQGAVVAVVLGDDADPAEKGAQHFKTYTCNACHSLDGSRLVGPSMKDLFGSERKFADGSTAIADAAYLRESILQPNAKVVESYPPVMILPKQPTDAEVDELIAYIESLSGDAGDASAASDPVAEAAAPVAGEVAVDEVAATQAEVPAEEEVEAVATEEASAPVEAAAAEAPASEVAASEEPAEPGAALLPARADADLVAAGKEAYQALTCFACHSLDGNSVVGPTFKGAYGTERKLTDGTTVVMDDDYVRSSILNPMAQVVEGYPPAMVLPIQPTEEQVDALVAFIASLGSAPAAAAPEAAAEAATPEAAAPAAAPAASDNGTAEAG